MPHPFFLSVRGEAASPEALVRAVVESRTADTPEVPEATYPDLAEKIVRTALVWQEKDSGRIIDPYVHRETPTATARYVGALGALMLQGRCHDLAGSCAKAHFQPFSSSSTLFFGKNPALPLANSRNEMYCI